MSTKKWISFLVVSAALIPFAADGSDSDFATATTPAAIEINPSSPATQAVVFTPTEKSIEKKEVVIAPISKDTVLGSVFIKNYDNETQLSVADLNTAFREKTIVTSKDSDSVTFKYKIYKECAKDGVGVSFPPDKNILYSETAKMAAIEIRDDGLLKCMTDLKSGSKKSWPDCTAETCVERSETLSMNKVDVKSSESLVKFGIYHDNDKGQVVIEPLTATNPFNSKVMQIAVTSKKITDANKEYSRQLANEKQLQFFYENPSKVDAKKLADLTGQISASSSILEHDHLDVIKMSDMIKKRSEENAKADELKKVSDRIKELKREVDVDDGFAAVSIRDELVQIASDHPEKKAEVRAAITSLTDAYTKKAVDSYDSEDSTTAPDFGAAKAMALGLKDIGGNSSDYFKLSLNIEMNDLQIKSALYGERTSAMKESQKVQRELTQMYPKACNGKVAAQFSYDNCSFIQDQAQELARSQQRLMYGPWDDVSQYQGRAPSMAGMSTGGGYFGMGFGAGMNQGYGLMPGAASYGYMPQNYSMIPSMYPMSSMMYGNRF